MKNITIIWWTSGFGEWVWSFILENFKDIKLIITWTNEKKAKIVAEKLKCDYSINNIEAVKNAQIVIFSIPIELTEKILKEVCPHIKSWSVVFDVTSIKTFPAKTMMQNVKKDVLVIPTHPMFWPYNSSIAWQIIVLTPDEKVKKDIRYINFKKFLKSLGAKTIESTPEEHDRMTAVIQWLTHYNMFLIWETLKKLWVDIKKSMWFVSPVYKILISSVSRYVSHNPKLYADIQMYNEEVLKVQDVFIETAIEFNKIVKNKDKENFVNTINNTKKFFWENALKWQKYTDKIIYMISKQVETFNKNIWKEIIIKNIYSKENVKWIFKELKDDTIYFEDDRSFNFDEWEII